MGPLLGKQIVAMLEKHWFVSNGCLKCEKISCQILAVPVGTCI